MQAFILGAGLGTRLAPLTSILPKPLMPVFQKPLIHHTMDHFMRYGVDSFIVNTSCLPLMWERAFPEGTYRGKPVLFSHEDEPLDSGGGVKKIRPLLADPAAPLLVHNGDIWTDIPVDELLAAHRAGGHWVTLALRSVDGKKNVGFNPATGLVTDMRHALGVDAGEYQFAGMYIMEPQVFDLFPADGEKFSVVPTWLELIKQGKVGGHVCDWANWRELGSPQTYLDAVLQASSRERIHPTAVIAATADIGEDCAIGRDARIPAGCALDDCIVWPRTHVEPGTYRRCIITPRITVQA